ncbi:hypothetical protein V1264_010531 [Littorina saxatilis]|uniref:Uncharacterized protein n=1 Tax=Littorina saxatilis TaxID=31220 RepID=A0AAN9APZ8_9CAEN
MRIYFYFLMNEKYHFETNGLTRFCKHTADLNSRQRADSKGEEVKAEVKLEGIPVAPGQQLPVLPSTSGPPETLEVLREILKDFVDKTVLHAKELLRDVMVLRNNAREEIQKLEVKVEVMSDVEATLKWVSDVVQGHHRQLPYMERNTTCVKVLNRQPADHQCRFCVCQKTIAEKTDLIGENPEESLSVIEHQVRSYVLSLERVKITYMEVVSLIATAQESVKGFLSDLLWREPGTSGYSELLDEDMDYEIMDAVQETLNIPEDTEELIRHAGFISHTLDSLTSEILDTLSHTTARMAEVKTQNESLDKVEEHTKKIRHLMDVTALDVARTRSREDYVQTSRILKGCVCPYCICYNSPFPDETRKTSKKQREAHQENLIMNISQLQQMMSLVLTTVEGPDHPLVSGVDPVVLDLVESAQTNLYSALDIILGDEERNKRRAEADPSGVSQSLNL